MQAGVRIGEGKRVDLFRYIGWLAAERHRARPADSDPYEEVKERARRRAAEVSRSGRDIGELPPVADPARRAAAEASLQVFCETYRRDVFYLPWSADHVELIATIEEVVLHGGLHAVAAPRGSGKTSLCEAACLWAGLKGVREFIVLIGAEEEHAIELLSSIKTEIECNELLLADFPEAIYPFRQLQGMSNRCKGQLYRGQRTHLQWKDKQIVFPMIPGSKASGVIIRVAGLLGRIRGMKHTRPDGRVVRPSLVICEDPQTDASAASPSMSHKRESVLAGAILNLAGPGRKIAGIMPCTVIRPGDMADRILNRKLHPEWQGRRYKLIYQWPTNEKLWQQYAEILRAPGGSYRENLVSATEFYRANQETMDQGARVAWPARYEEGEISALQHAMNLKLRDEAAFFAEMQNQPQLHQHGGDWCNADEIAAKLNRVPEGVVPADLTLLTAMIDVHDKLLYWLVAAFDLQFNGAVIAYGTHPKQARSYFTMREVRQSLARMSPGAGKDGAIHNGLKALTDELLHREWPGTDGSVHRIKLCLVDEGYKPKIVRTVIRSSRYRSLLMPSRGLAIRAAHKPFTEYKKHPGDRIGHNWRMPKPDVGQIRGVQFDANFWKSQVHTFLKTTPGDKGCLQLFGDKPHRHRMLADHVADSEYFVVTHGRGRSVNEWQERPNHPDNHIFDDLVGVVVAASIEGAQLPGTGKPKRKGRKLRFRRS